VLRTVANQENDEQQKAQCNGNKCNPMYHFSRDADGSRMSPNATPESRNRSAIPSGGRT
jgi:hypothetical protein